MRTGTHDVAAGRECCRPVWVLSSNGGIAVAVKPAAKASDRPPTMTAGDMIITAGDGCRQCVHRDLCCWLKPLLLPSLKLHHGVPAGLFSVTILIRPPVLPPPYSDVAPEITSICSILNGSMAVKLAAIGTRRVETHAVNQHDQRRVRAHSCRSWCGSWLLTSRPGISCARTSLNSLPP